MVYFSSAQNIKVEILETKIICKQQERYIGWPTVTQIQSGELLVVFSGNRDAHVCPFGITQMVRSRDNGKSWSKPVTINNTPLDDRDAGILQTTKGTLLVNWFTSVAFDHPRYYEKHPEWKRHAEKLGGETREYWLGNWTRRSLKNGKTWETPVKQLVSAPHGPIELRDGRILYLGTASKNGKKILGVEQSMDDGESWQLISEIPISQEDSIQYYHEPHLVELNSGKIVAMFRYQPKDRDQHYMRQSESYDGGKNWTPTYKTNIWGYPPHLIQLKNNWILVSYGVRREPFGEYACLSRDQGQSWDFENQIIINSAINGDLGYPASVQLEDETIYTVYYQIDLPGEKTSLMGTLWRMNN
jgi:sialidase-1